jgi:hypothetical protein
MASEQSERGPAKAKKTSSSKHGAKRPGSRAAERQPERVTRETEEPVLSGRLVWIVAMFAAMVFIPLSPLSGLIEKKGPTATKPEHWSLNREGTVHLTVVTADYNKLGCAHPDAAGPNHCAFQNEKQPWPRDPNAPLDDNKRNIVQPYRTVDGQLLMLAGLWAQPAVAMRLHNEPPQGIAENKLARFTAQCRVKFIAEWKQPLIRWAPGQQWSRQGDALVAEPISCEVLTTKRPGES